MRKHFILFLATFALVFSQQATAQTKRSAKGSTATKVQKSIATEKAEAYLDSLRIYKKQIDSLMSVNDSLRSINGMTADSKTFRLFAPTTYYSDITRRSMNGGTTENDKALMDIYMKRPDLVMYSSRKLNSETPDNESDSSEQAPEKVSLTAHAANVTAAKQDDAQGIKQDNMDMYVAKPKFWTFNGDYYLQFMQNYVSDNWYKSGSSNYSMLGSVTVQYNYNNKQKVKWDNKLEMKIGFMTSESDTVNKFKTSEDLIRLTSKFGLQAHKNWYYTALLVANTQFTKGRKDNQKGYFSDFLTPLNVNISLGMDYNANFMGGKLKGSIHIAPIAYNLKFVEIREILVDSKVRDLSSSFGIEKGKHALHDYGSQVTIDMVWTPWDFFKWQMRMYGYTTYSKFEFECENTLTFKFNKYISANLFLYPRFDDSVKKKEDYTTFWQFKEYLSLGFSYSM